MCSFPVVKVCEISPFLHSYLFLMQVLTTMRSLVLKHTHSVIDFAETLLIVQQYDREEESE